MSTFAEPWIFRNDREQFLFKRYNATMRFIATMSGLTRWEYIFGEDENSTSTYATSRLRIQSGTTNTLILFQRIRRPAFSSNRRNLVQKCGDPTSLRQVLVRLHSSIRNDRSPGNPSHSKLCHISQRRRHGSTGVRRGLPVLPFPLTQEIL